MEAYLKADAKRWLLGTLCVGEEVFFLPSYENEYEMVERLDDNAVRTMLQEYQESCDMWE